jgi:hypothetical protein
MYPWTKDGGASFHDQTRQKLLEKVSHSHLPQPFAQNSKTLAFYSVRLKNNSSIYISTAQWFNPFHPPHFFPLLAKVVFLRCARVVIGKTVSHRLKGNAS